MIHDFWARYSFFLIILIYPIAMFVSSTVGGWKTLAEFYRKPPDKKRENKPIRITTVGMRFFSYNGFIFGTADSDGLHVHMHFLSRPFHPPLFIPWADITAERRENRIRININKTPGISFEISEHHAKTFGIIDRFKL